MCNPNFWGGARLRQTRRRRDRHQRDPRTIVRVESPVIEGVSQTKRARSLIGSGRHPKKAAVFTAVAILALTIGLSWTVADASAGALHNLESYAGFTAALQFVLMSGVIATPMFDPCQDPSPDDATTKLTQAIDAAQLNGMRSPQLSPPPLFGFEERLMRQISVELHNGPAQLIALALLQLDTFLAPSQRRTARSATEAAEPTGTIRACLQQAMHEIRTISAGLAPDFDGLSPTQVIQLAVNNFQERTHTLLICRLTNLPATAPVELKVCVYRFIEEGLRNAFAQARDARHEIGATWESGILQVEVINAGPEETFDGPEDPKQLANRWLRHRVETFGGEFKIDSLRGAGTRIVARFSVNERNTFDD